MVNTAIQPFDVNEHIRGKVREALIGAIPEDRLDAMIRREYSHYFEEFPMKGGPPTFRSLVRETIDAHFKLVLKQYFDKNFYHEWDEGVDRLVGEAVAAMIPTATQAFMADLADLEQVRGLAVMALDFLGGIDVLVNNAGITMNRPFEKVTPEQFVTLYYRLSYDYVPVPRWPIHWMNHPSPGWEGVEDTAELS